MPYSKAHKARTRERILASAAKLFPRLGFDAVSIDALMREAGLTRGAFYAHFTTKSEVYAEAMFFTATNSPFSKLDAKDVPSNEWFEQTVAPYLSREHIEDSASPCPLAFLVNDSGQRDTAVRGAYTRLYAELAALIHRRQGQDAHVPDAALAATAMMIGGVAIARALEDTALADKLLAACRDELRKWLRIDEPRRAPSAQSTGLGIKPEGYVQSRSGHRHRSPS